MEDIKVRRGYGKSSVRLVSVDAKRWVAMHMTLERLKDDTFKVETDILDELIEIFEQSGLIVYEIER